MPWSPAATPEVPRRCPAPPEGHRHDSERQRNAMISAATRTWLRALCFLAALCAFPLHTRAAETAPAATRPASHPSTQPAIKWEQWSDDVFERAKREHKF